MNDAADSLHIHDIAELPSAHGPLLGLDAERDKALRKLQREGRLPKHVAVIMDGNGRWAQARGGERKDGHRAGAESVRAVTRLARQLGIETLTLYAFSEQNWGRPQAEVQALLQLLVEYLSSELNEMRRTGIRLHAIGNIARLPLTVRLALQTAIAATAGHRSMNLALCLSYGSREEMVHAVQQLAQKVAAGQLKPDQIDEKAIEQQLWTAPLQSAPDLIVRTSGEQRLSNFLLWQAAYAELVFVATEWPDFRQPAFADALLEFSERQRRFGGIAAKSAV